MGVQGVRREEQDRAAGSAAEGAQEQPPDARDTPPGDLEGSLGFLLHQVLQNYGPHQVVGAHCSTPPQPPSVLPCAAISALSVKAPNVGAVSTVLYLLFLQYW